MIAGNVPPVAAPVAITVDMSEVTELLGSILAGVVTQAEASQRLAQAIGVVRADLTRQAAVLKALSEKVGTLATQADIDALSAEIDDVSGKLTTAVSGVETEVGALNTAQQAVVAEIATLEGQIAAGQDVDLTALKGKIDALDAIDVTTPLNDLTNAVGAVAAITVPPAAA